MLTVKSKSTSKKLMLDKDILNILYPVGSLYLTTSAANPQTTLGGTWTLVAPGKCLVGYDANDGDFNEVEKTGGEKTHKLIIDEMPSHRHSLITRFATQWNGAGGAAIQGSSTTNINPYDFDWIENTGGGFHTTTYHPTLLSKFGKEQLRQKGGDFVCLK